MAEQPRFVVAEGPIARATAKAAGIPDTKYVFQFSSALVLCKFVSSIPAPEATAPEGQVGDFVNNVKCRKWTDLSGQTVNLCKLPDADAPHQPPNGCLVNIGDITITTTNKAPPPKTYVCDNFTLEGTQTHRAAGSNQTVFLFTGKGDAQSGERVTGVGTCLETLVPDGAPQVGPWHFVFTIC